MSSVKKVYKATFQLNSLACGYYVVYSASLAFQELSWENIAAGHQQHGR